MIFLAVTKDPTTVLTRVELDIQTALTQGVHKANGGREAALIGPFHSHLAAHYVWWQWARRGLRRITTAVVVAAEQAALSDGDPAWAIERETQLTLEGMTSSERADLEADMAAEYEPEVVK